MRLRSSGVGEMTESNEGDQKYMTVQVRVEP